MTTIIKIIRRKRNKIGMKQILFVSTNKTRFTSKGDYNILRKSGYSVCSAREFDIVTAATAGHTPSMKLKGVHVNISQNTFD